MFDVRKSAFDLCAYQNVVKKFKSRLTQKITTNHFVQQQKVPNSSNRHFYECNCSTSIEGRDYKHLKHILDQNACPTARTEVRNYLATKKGNHALLLQKQILFHPRQLQEARPKLHPQKRKNLFGFVDLLFTPELTTRANFKLFQ
jgi:hypothetical protein